VGIYAENASEYAQRAAYITSGDATTEAIGTGLAAVANAVLELAEQIDILRQTMEERLTPPSRPTGR
jgi:hypothetical protein